MEVCVVPQSSVGSGHPIAPRVHCKAASDEIDIDTRLQYCLRWSTEIRVTYRPKQVLKVSSSMLARNVSNTEPMLEVSLPFFHYSAEIEETLVLHRRILSFIQ